MERSFLYDLDPEQAERLRLIRAGLPIPKHLEPVKNPGNKIYPKLPPTPPMRTLTKADLHTPARRDKRRIHKKDPRYSNLLECGLFWRNHQDGKELLRHTESWDETTCRRCLANRETGYRPPEPTGISAFDSEHGASEYRLVPDTSEPPSGKQGGSLG